MTALSTKRFVVVVVVVVVGNFNVQKQSDHYMPALLTLCHLVCAVCVGRDEYVLDLSVRRGWAFRCCGRVVLLGQRQQQFAFSLLQ